MFDYFYSYAKGYMQGLTQGVMDIPETLSETDRYLWRAGYDRGVSDYCETIDNGEA